MSLYSYLRRIGEQTAFLALVPLAPCRSNEFKLAHCVTNLPAKLF
jgi:hypothetical protein